MNYRPDIDGLRAVAVASVVLCHAGLGFPGGFVGVDVFFVISGYLITCLMLKDLDAGTFSLAQFWQRRIRRILPALVFVVMASFVAGWFLLGPTAYHAFGCSVDELVILKANIHFSHDIGYFAASAEDKPLLHTWSLAVEEQFYLVIPLLFGIVVRFGRRSWLEPIVALITMLSFAAGFYGVFSENQAAYFKLSTRAWELLAGVALAIRLYNRSPVAGFPVAMRWREAFAALGLAGIVLPCLCYDARTPFPGLAALPPVVGAMLLIGLGADTQRKTWVHRLLESRSAVYIGLISYSLYLWHWPLIVFFKQGNVAPPTNFERVLLVAMSLALAVVTQRCIETPFRQRRWLASRSSLIVTTAVVLIALHAGGKKLRSTNGWVERLPPHARIIADTGVCDPRFMTIHFAAHVPDQLLKVGAEGSEPELLVWGDSHAMAIMPGVDEICRASGVVARGVVHTGLSPIAAHLASDSPRIIADTNALSDAVKNYLKSSRIRAVILAARWGVYQPHPRFTESLLQTVDELNSFGCHVYFMKDVPEYDCDVVARLTQSAWHGHASAPLSVSVSPQEYATKNPFYETLLPQLIAHGATILDPIPVLQARTNSLEIPASDAGGLFYRDTHHLSGYGGKAIKPMFTPVVDTLLAQRSIPPIQSTETAQPILTADGARGMTKQR
ncbi:MAG: acyltransferase [Planctomycetia bacterium]|nr:acyltransferase [Planctomycetia bacterium]